jgi:hypothetical protein
MFLKDASEREFNVFLEYKKGNIVLTFSAAAFEEFIVIANNILLSSGLTINQTNTADLKGVYHYFVPIITALDTYSCPSSWTLLLVCQCLRRIGSIP